jgi:lysophospholipase L1-like esterase
VALFVIIAVLQFGLFEAGLRTWGSSEAAPAFQGLFITDPATGYRLKPHARVRFTTAEFDTEIATNGDGIRDDEEIGPKAPNERRIVLLGDSLVLSVQVSFRETFGELLEARLNQRGSPFRHRVINAGVQGFGPIEEQLFFRALAQRFDPDVVLVALFVGNDAEEAVTSEPKLGGQSQTASDTVRTDLTARIRRIVRRSMVLQIARLRAAALTDRFRGVLGPPEPPLQSYAATPAPRIDRGLAITRAAVSAIAEQASSLGARTGIVLMPARFQVDDADYGRLREAVAQAGGELVRDGATLRFDAALSTLPLPRVDVLPALRTALPGPASSEQRVASSDLFFQQTVHLTPRGHRVVAEALEQFLDRSGLLEPSSPARR